MHGRSKKDFTQKERGSVGRSVVEIPPGKWKVLGQIPSWHINLINHLKVVSNSYFNCHLFLGTKCRQQKQIRQVLVKQHHCLSTNIMVNTSKNITINCTLNQQMQFDQDEQFSILFQIKHVLKSSSQKLLHSFINTSY